MSHKKDARLVFNNSKINIIFIAICVFGPLLMALIIENAQSDQQHLCYSLIGKYHTCI